MDDTFAFKYLKGCQYILLDNSPEQYLECGEPAIVLGWWDDGGPDIRLCQKHLDFILEKKKDD